MSVVNKMLRDLQQHKPEQTLKLDEADDHSTTAGATENAIFSAKAVLLTCLTCIGLAAVVFVFVFNPSKDVTESTSLANVSDASSQINESQKNINLNNQNNAIAAQNFSEKDTSMSDKQLSQSREQAVNDTINSNLPKSSSAHINTKAPKALNDKAQNSLTEKVKTTKASSSALIANAVENDTDNHVEQTNVETRSMVVATESQKPTEQQTADPKKSLSSKRSNSAKTATKDSTVKNLSTAQQKKQQLQMANGLIENGLFGKAEQQLKQLLNQHKGYHPAAEKLAYVYLQTQNNDALTSLLEQQITEYPGHTTYRILLARYYADKRQWQNVIHATSNEQTNNTLILMRTLALQQLGQHQTAIELYVNLLRQSPERGDWWIGLSVSLEAVKRYRDAHQALVKAANDPRVTQPQHQYIAQKTQYLQGLF